MKERKKKQCKIDGCVYESYILNKKMCPYHYSLSKGTPTKKYYLRKQSEKNKEKRKKRGELLKVYYEHHLEQIKKKPFCENCGCRLQGTICNIAHIIPKSVDISICDELLNCMYLCSGFDGIDCHNRFDKTQNSSKVYLMNCFKIALERFLQFKDKSNKYSKSKQIFEDWIEENDTST